VKICDGGENGIEMDRGRRKERETERETEI
jgi:serine/threonine protein kinase